MIGKFQLQLGSEQLVSGMSSSDYAQDGALGVSSVLLNPFVTPGVMRPLASGTNLSVNLADSIIASCEDSQASFAYNRTMVGDAGNYYTYNGSTLAKTNTATTNAAGYITGTTDMVAFAGNTYVSTTTDIDLWNTSGPTLTNSWWVGTKSQSALNSGVRHPMLTYQGFLNVADKNQIHTISSTGTIAIGVLVLNSNEIINALGIDPATGLMMVSVNTTQNYSDTASSPNFVYLWDGISAKALRKIPVDDLITAFKNVSGVVYVGAGETLGQWNGNGVTFLRKFQSVAFSGSDLPYKQHFANTRNILHVIDGPSILSYGEPISGKKGFFYTATDVTGLNNHITAVTPLGADVIGIAYVSGGTKYFWAYDFASTSQGNMTLFFNNIYFPRPIFVRRMRIFTTGVGTTTTAGDGTVLIIDEKNTFHTTSPAAFINTTGSTKYIFDFDYSSLELQAIQARIITDTLNWGIVRIVIYYDIAQ